ncbi:MAG: glycosyltransferase family 4 protein [Bacteroidia bacterium]
MKILFVVPYPTGKAASQRFRFEQYYSLLDSKNIEYDIKPFLSDKIWNILYLPGQFPRKAAGIIGGILKRFGLLFKLKQYDFIFIHREATPVGPSFFEYFASRWLKKKIIYDFDDAIWIPNYSEANSFFSFLKGYSNVKKICAYAWKVSCGNSYLCSFASQFNSSVVYNPTTIDTVHLHNRSKNQQEKPFVIGWTGSHSTVRYLNELVSVIKELEQKYDFEFQVISDLPPDLDLKSLRFIKWSKESEIDDLIGFNIGVMPLLDDKWAKGKCGFKALQYMSLGIPALVSPVGVNTHIVDHGVNGFICTSSADWKDSIENLLNDQELLEEMSKNTREKIESKFSVNSNSSNFLALFEQE